jgi:hypothetical protein
LLTGDTELRALADADGVDFFAVLWILDHLFDRSAMEAVIIVTGPGAIAARPRCRLPRAEIQVRLKPAVELASTWPSCSNVANWLGPNRTPF